MLSNRFAVYIMANARPTLYVGVTNNLLRRVSEHRNEANEKSFTARYHPHRLIYFELFETPMQAIVREKQIKAMTRSEKLELIRAMNPALNDLWEQVCEVY